MTTVIINEKTKKGRIILDLIKEMGIGQILHEKSLTEPSFNEDTIQAIQDVQSGNTIVCENYDDYMSRVKP